MHDALVTRRWPEILPLLDPLGLVARFVAAEDESVDDAIEIRRTGDAEDQDVGDIQFCDQGWFGASSWTSEARDERRHGGLHRTVLAACEDLVENLRRDGMV